MQQMQYDVPNCMYVFKTFSGVTFPAGPLLVLESRVGPPSKILAARLQGFRLDVWKYFSERVVDRWNGLDKETINTKTINSFKKALDGVKKAKIDFFTD